MNRRCFLAVTGTALFSGCVTGTGGDDGTTPAPTPAKTSTATATPAPTPTATPRPTQEPPPTEELRPLDPIAKLANPVYRWTGYGDAIRNTVSGVGRGAEFQLAGRFKIWFHDGTLDYTVQARAYDSSGDRVESQLHSSRQTTDMNGHNNWEVFLSFDTTTWDNGNYGGEYVVHDNILDESSFDESSDSIEWTVDVVDPLRNGDAVLADQNIPESVRVDETFDYSLTLENTTDRDSSIVSTTSTRVDGGEWYDTDEETSYTIPAGEAIEYPISGASLSEPGRYEFRLDTVGITWEINVTAGQ